MISGVRWRGCDAGVLGKIGGELEVVYWELEAGFRWNGRGRRVADFAEEERENWVLSDALDALSLSGRQKAVKEEWSGGFIRGWMLRGVG